jgi:hypothetical protein
LPIAALDFGEIVGIVIIVLSILGWFVRAVKGQAENPPPPRRMNPNLGRTEIETFLEEISGGAPKRPPARAQPPNRPPAAKIAKKPGKPPPKAKPARPTKPDSPLAEKHLASSNLGSGLRSHVSTYMQADRVSAEVKQDLKSRISDDVQADLGPASLTAAASTSTAPAPVHPLVALLRDPRGVRQAIALQEILQKPKALRQG